MLDFLYNGLDTSGFMPHGHCFLWAPSLLWTYVFSDSVIAASYYSIPFALWYFSRKRQDLPYRWIFIIFGIFVMACGTTHLFAILDIWKPSYWADAGVKAFTALASAATAIAIWRIMPFALAIPSRVELEQFNHTLQTELRRRKQAEDVLKDMHEHLEERVAKQTAELSASNDRFRKLNRALEAISACNKVLIHAADEHMLLNDMCRVIVETAGYKLAWVGFVEHDAEKTVRHVAHAGYENSYLERDQVTWADNEAGHGPTGTAIRTKNPSVINDALTDPAYLIWREHAVKLGYRSILALPLVTHGQTLGALTIFAGETNRFSKDEIDLLNQLSEDLAFGIVAQRFRKLQEESSGRLQRSLGGTIKAISAIVEMRDPYTAGHQHRVSELAVAIAREMQLPEDEIHGLYFAGEIHDLGKIRIPAEILSKPGKLSDIEYQMIQTHPQEGYDILKEIEFPWPVAQIVYQHHERLDGSGYPNGLKDAEILIGAKILAVADTVEAMSSHRPYRPSIGIAGALEEIERYRGVRYDADAVNACLKIFREPGHKLLNEIGFFAKERPSLEQGD